MPDCSKLEYAAGSPPITLTNSSGKSHGVKPYVPLPATNSPRKVSYRLKWLYYKANDLHVPHEETAGRLTRVSLGDNRQRSMVAPATSLFADLPEFNELVTLRNTAAEAIRLPQIDRLGVLPRTFDRGNQLSSGGGAI